MTGGKGITSVDTQVPALITRLDRVRTELAECRPDFERVRVRDEAHALREAAAILRRRDIQTEASILVCDVERAIHKANPGRQGARTDLNLVSGNNDVSSEVKRQIRWAHSKLSDGDYAALVAQKRTEQEPLTRSEVRAWAVRRMRDRGPVGCIPSPEGRYDAIVLEPRVNLPFVPTQRFSLWACR